MKHDRNLSTSKPACIARPARTGSTSWRASMAGISAALPKGCPVTLEYTGMRGSLSVTLPSICACTAALSPEQLTHVKHRNCYSLLLDSMSLTFNVLTRSTVKGHLIGAFCSDI